MEIVSLCPLRVASVLWQPRPSAWVLTVVCKATYQLQPGMATLAREQEAPHEADNHWDDDPGRSLYAASDLVPVKPRVDVLLVGSAFAPGKLPVRSLVARLSVGEIDKAIEVFCDRTFSPGGHIIEGPRLARIPLLYERAAGGPESWNPVGMRFDAADRAGKRAVPNLQPIGTVITSPADYVAPIGFGPLAPSWPPRREKLGHLAGSLDSAAWRSGALPEGMDLFFFNTAPPDQQLQALRDDERITLENLHPDHPRLVTSLPGQKPRAVVEAAGSASRALQMRADTLWIDTDQSICTVTWRGQLPLAHPQQQGRVVISLEEAAQAQVGTTPGRSRFGSSPMVETGAEHTSTPSSARGSENPLEGTVVGALKPVSSVLPFAAQTGAPPPQGEMRERATSAGLPFAPAVAAPRQRDSSPSWPSFSDTSSVPQPPPPRPSSPSMPAVVPPPRPSQPSSSWPPVAPPPVASRPGLDAPRDPTPPPLASSPWAASVSAGAPPGLTVGAAAVAAAAEPESVARNDGSLLGASNAAADAVPWGRPRNEPSKAATEPAFDAPLSAGLGEDAALHLVWFDPESVPRIRRKPAFRQVIKAAEDAPFDPDLDDPAFASDPMALEERREVFEVLARSQPVDDAGLRDALADAVRRDGKFVPPLALVDGELYLPFDELETLKATVGATTAFASSDERLKGAITDAEAVLQKADMPVGPAILQVLTARIREAFASGKRPISSTDLDVQIERALLSKRRYQRREIFGGLQLRALLSMSGVKEALPTYLPDGLAKQLPMAARLRVRLVAELYFAMDQYETSPAALKALALGWAMSTRRR